MVMLAWVRILLGSQELGMSVVAGLQNFQNIHSLRAMPYKVPQSQLRVGHSIERFDAPVIQCIDHWMGENLDSKLTFVAQCP